jgi:amino acid adenylation domain-containing protein
MVYQLWHFLRESAARRPDAVAVQGPDGSLTYAQLDERSGRLAALLAEAGVVPGTRVGFMLPKSVAAVVTIFGVLKAGGVYVPIDTASPRGRLGYIVRNCGIRHLVTRPEHAATVAQALADPPGDALALLLLADADAAAEPSVPTPPAQSVKRWRELDAYPPHPGIEGGCDSDLAYILYTSGSTGAPKGVMITHRASLTFVDWARERFGVSERDVVSSHAPLHFDLSIFDIFASVSAGARIVLVPDRLSTFPVKLAQFIRDERITIWYSVPSALTLMLERGNFAAHEYPALRVVLFAGEVFPIKFLQALMRATRAELFNLYGPTETNVCTYYAVRPSDLDRPDPVPIGVPIANYDVFAVDQAGARVTAVGVTGELWARGLLLVSPVAGHEPGTARTLRPNPLLPHLPNDRIFATGDIVSLDRDGSFVYHGRRDNMVKSRGYRIELGEVEAALYRHPKVRETAVLAVADPTLTNRLRAVVALDGEGGVSVEELKEFCRQELPRYMVPDSIELRERLPKTSTGKIDRQALAAEDPPPPGG